LTAGLAVALGRNGLEHILDIWPRLLVSTGHDGWAVTGTFLTSGHTGSDESDALLSQVFASSVGVGEVGVAAVDDDVALLDTGLEDGLDECVNGSASLDQQHHASGFLELGDEILDAVRADDGFALGLVGQEGVDLGDCSVEGHDSEAVISHIEDQVLAHDGQANEAEIAAAHILESCRALNFANPEDSETGKFFKLCRNEPRRATELEAVAGLKWGGAGSLRRRRGHDGVVVDGRLVNWEGVMAAEWCWTGCCSVREVSGWEAVEKKGKG
jgi:hypothetical protein